MIRTLFRLEPEEKDWLRRCARSERVSMAEVIRRAVRLYRVRRDYPPPPPDQLLLWDDPGLWAAANDTRLRQVTSGGPGGTVVEPGLGARSIRA
ncbi:MAG TPA: ribbon-helix-helix protein, CopG family [Thermoanaerobaculia bacterium]|nr:ribbon-helix-helix protein, CopG family [Thermoanaerobaculia bacterium]